jgi:hypothetical protein
MWQNDTVSVSAVSAPVLTRHNVAPGRGVEIENVDTRYHRLVNISPAHSPTAAVPEYMFLTRSGQRNDIVIQSYGFSQGRTLSLPFGRRAVIAPSRGMGVTVIFPAEWEGTSLRLTETAEQPVTRIVLRPGERLSINNRIENESGFVPLQINGHYFLRDESAWGTSAEESPLHSGTLNVLRGANLTVTAAPGVDLEIVMPTEWRARLLR